MSNKFTASNGVKQGAILSPILFSELFERLEKSGVGCHMGNHYTGSIGYADDLTLLAPTLSGLQVLIKICERYADEFDIKFNRAKSVYMVFGGRRCKCDNRIVMVNGAEFHRVNATVHLGHHISTDDNDSLVSAAIGQFCRGAIPQKRLPQGEKMKVTYKVCFPLKINEEGLPLDDEVKKVGNYMTSISFSAIKRYTILQEL